MKAVNKIILPFLLFFSSVCVSADSNVEGIKSIEYVHQKVVSLAGKLEKNIELCSIARKKAVIPEIDKKMILTPGVDKRSIVQGLSYLSNRNFEFCEGSYRVDLAYQLGILQGLGDFFDVELPPVTAIKASLIYPTSRDINAEMAFEKLPPDVREYILKVVGESPFDLLKTISHNKLLEE